MTLQGRNLSQGLTGADVTDLQTALAQLSYAVPATEQQASSFGTGTLAAVEQFQTNQGLPSTGIVDATTAAALTAVITASTYVVTGTVSSPVSAGVAGLALQLVDKNVGGDVKLASGQTGAGGAYSISAVVSPASLKQKNKTQPDLQVQVSSGTTLLAASTVWYNAPLSITLDVSLPTTATGLASEYESLTASVQVLYKGALSALKETTEQQDITFLANKSGWDARAVAMAALADQFSQITAPAPPTPASGTSAPAGTVPAAPTGVTATVGADVLSEPKAIADAPVASTPIAPAPVTPLPIVPKPVIPAPVEPTPVAPAPVTPLPIAPKPVIPAPVEPAPVAPAPVAPAPVAPAPPAAPAAPTTVNLAPEFYYALFRAGLPADTNSLFRTPATSVQTIWQQAITQGVIPEALASQVPAAVKTYQTLAAVNLLTAKPAVGISTLGDMLTASTLTAAQQTTFSQLYAQYADDPTTLWKSVSASLGATLTTRLQLDGQLHYLSLNNAPLVTALHASEPNLTSPLDLVGLGYYDANKWKSLIGTTVPPQIPGQSADNYAELLAAQVRLSYPTAVAADQVKRGTFPITDTPVVAAAVSDFLQQQYSEFAIGAEPVEAFIKRTKMANPPAANVVTQIKRLQRVYQLTSDDQTMSVLLNHNLDSAYAITRYDSAGFHRAFQNPLGGADIAAATYARAQHIYSTVLNATISYLGARQAPTLGGLTTILSGFPSAPVSQPYPVVAYPTLETLFGSLDYCTCEDCRSILSPAAYLVDLLNYVDQPAPSPAYLNPQTVLLNRRPDLQYLPLTCDNTNTALPYIDIVNETLEYYVANQLSLTNFQGYSTDDTVTSAELLANPQFVNNAAYATLQNVYFPPPLPFNRPLALLRQLFQTMGVALPDIMDALRTSISTSISQTGTNYGAADILIEQLGISRNEYTMLTDSTLGTSLKPNLQGLYGYPSTDIGVLSTLQTITLQDFSRRTGVSYDDIVSILQTQFINPNAILIERLERLNVPFSNLKKLNATPSTAAAFIAGLPAGLDARAYGGSTPTDYAAVVAWVTHTANFDKIMSIITLSTPSSNMDQCSGSSFQFLYSGGNSLTATDFVKLIRFIRLWQKLDLSIEQTDDILTALYPAADLPSGTNDAVNIPLLDSGFQTTLLRIGVLFQIMSRLSLTANESLGFLLACWAPIGTVGDNALYQQMFGGPAVQQEDAGAPIANVGGGPNAGDTFVTTINSVQVSQVVSSGDTPATLATKIAAQINQATTKDPTTTFPLNDRIYASSQNGVVVIRAGFTLQCEVSTGATETFNAAMLSPLSQTATVAGPVTAGNLLTATINTVPISYTVQAADTLASIAAGIASAINNNTNPDPYSGLPLNSLLVAWSSAAVVTVTSVNSGAPLSLQCSITLGTSGAYTAGPQVQAHQTATVGGTIASGDVLTSTINGVAVPFAVTTQTTAVAVAAAIVTTINGTSTADPVSGMALNSILHASSNGAVITITAKDPATPLSLACSATGAMTYTAASPTATFQPATVSGEFAPNAVLTTTVNAVTLPYTVAAADTPTTIATNIANAIKSSTALDAVTNTPLNQLVSAGASAGVITITARSTTGAFNLTVSASTGTYTAGVQPPPFADNGYGDFLSDPSQTIFGHEPVLRAAFNLTGAEFTLITNTLQFNYSTPLTLNNISSVFRVGWMAHTLGMSVMEFLLLRQATGLDPFAALDPGSSVPVDPPVIRFIRLVQALSNAGLRPVQALYLLWNQDIGGKSTPDPSVITGLAFALRAAFLGVAAQFNIQSDPDGTIAKGLMALVYGNTATDFYFGLLNNTLVTSINYPNSSYPSPQPPPAQAVIDASGGRLSYDNLGKQLNFAGVLDAQTQALMKTAITAQGVQALLQALPDLVKANSQMVGPFFTTYPELLPLYVAYVTSTDPVQQKRTALLATFLPTLILKRNQEQALATVTAAAGTDASFANALLDDATILHSATDATAPIVNDLTALSNPGLAAQIFLSNNPSGPPDIVQDADPASYAPSTIAAQQIATVSGNVTANDVLTTVINGVSVPYTVAAGDKTAANVAAGIAKAIAAAVTPDLFSGLPLKDVVTATAQGGAVTVQASNFGSGVKVSCSVTPASAPPTYTAGSPVPASQTATVAGTITAGDVLTTTVNTIAIAYTVVASDTSVAILAAHIAAAINATATADPASGLPLNQVVTATSAGAVITVTADSLGPDLTLTCALSAGAKDTYTAGAQVNASQAATLSAVPRPNDIVITTVNSVVVQYTVLATDTTLAGLATNVAAAINATATVDTVTNKPLNTIVKASSAPGVVTIGTIPPGVAFTLACSLSLGSYTLNSQVAIWQCAIVAGGITAGDILSTTINATTVVYNVTGSEASLSVVAANIVAALQATAALTGVVSVANVGGIITFQGSSAFTLTCFTSSSTLPEATATYSAGPQFPAWQATLAQGFSAGDVLTTGINDASVPYTIGATDISPTAIAADMAKQINASVAVDPLTGLPVNGLVVASSSEGVITFRSAGPAVVMSCSISAGATEIYAIAGEFPARTAGAPIAGIWSGYLNAPQDGFYNIEIDTDPGAVVTLSIASEPVPMTPSANKSVWSNQGPISLTAGQLTEVEIAINSLRSSLSLNWQSAGLGWQTIPAVYLYSDTQVDRLQTAYVRFLKATSLATSLSLTADEIAFLGTSTGFAVNTTDTDNFSPGTVTFTPASMTNIAKGSMLVIDSGPAQEIVTVTAVTKSTFTAAVVNPHDGTLTPFPIVDMPDASTGHGWLNLLLVSPIATSVTAGLQPVTTYTAGPQTPAAQTATVGGTIKTGDALTTTINGLATTYTVAAADTSVAILAGHIAAAINANTNPDPTSSLPLNQEVVASSAGGIVAITAAAFGPAFTLACSVSAGATETYAAGPQTQASQTATLSGALPLNQAVVTSINSVTVTYTVTPTDTTTAILASNVVKAINAATAVDSLTNRPLNKLISASSTGAVITITTLSPGAFFALNCSIARFRGVLDDVLNFARIKAAVSPNDEQLLAVVENPNLLAADGSTYQIVKLTGWALSSLNSLLQNFFGSTQLSNLSSIGNLRRVFDAYAFVTSCRLSAAALLAATTNAPTPATVASLQSALRALYAGSDWLNVVHPINDALRILSRDALVAYILQQLGDKYANSVVTLQTSAASPAGSTTLTFASAAKVKWGMGVQGLNIPANAIVNMATSNTVILNMAVSAHVPSGTSVLFAPSGVPDVSTADDLYEHFLIDVETQPPVETSRIRLALSTVQLFIERVLRNLEPQCLPTDIDGSLWTWMKRYRVWEANREVFLWPENWLYPELRDDQSPIFQQMMSALLQSDITADAAAAAYLDYLSNLELVAKLEPCGLYYVPPTGDTDETSYVIARTAGAHRKYYFRQLQYGSWTPWTEVQVDCEDMPITPIVWNGRLMLFWLKITKTTKPQAAAPSTPLTGKNTSSTHVMQLSLDDLQAFGSATGSLQTQGNVSVSAVLCWSEFYNGKWQPQKSSDVNRPVNIGTFDTSGRYSFDGDRNLIQIVPKRITVKSTISDALLLAIVSPLFQFPNDVSPVFQPYDGFVLYNTHSLPVRWQDISLPYIGGPLRWTNTLDLFYLVLPPSSWRTFQPTPAYTGGMTSGPFNVSYWVLDDVSPAPSSYDTRYQNTILGLNRVPRTVDSVSSSPGWDAPFFFEDRRNVFYVTTTETSVPFYTALTYGIVATNVYTASFSPTIPPLVLDNPVRLSPGSAAVSQFDGQKGVIHATFGSATSLVYQGTTLYPTGQAPERAALALTLAGSTTKKPT